MSSELSSSHLPQILDSVVKFRSKVRSHALKTGKDSTSKSALQINQPVGDSSMRPTESKLPDLPDKPPESKGDISWTTKGLKLPPLSDDTIYRYSRILNFFFFFSAPSFPKMSKSVRKEQDPLLHACDAFRNEMLFSGIHIKVSFWKI